MSWKIQSPTAGFWIDSPTSEGSVDTTHSYPGTSWEGLTLTLCSKLFSCQLDQLAIPILSEARGSPAFSILFVTLYTRMISVNPKFMSFQKLRMSPYLDRCSLGLSCWVRVGPKSNDWCSYKKERGHTQTWREDGVKTQRHMGDGRWPMGSDWSQAATYQGPPGTAGSFQSERKAWDRASRRSQPCRHLDLGFLAS